jgi:hypothetical protein
MSPFPTIEFKMLILIVISDLNIQTAGTSAIAPHRGLISALIMVSDAEGRLPGVSKEVAEQLRDELIERARKSKNQGL